MTTGYRQLEDWERAMDVATDIYALAKDLPRQEEFRITSQLVRAAISIPANIAEGNARSTRKDYAHFVGISRGSAAELETLLLLVERAHLAPAERVAPLLSKVEAVSRMLNRLQSRLREPNP